jgi:RNA polymerase sigma-70 factor (ECF subfamily)
MPEPMPSRSAEEALLQRVIFDAVWEIAWESLARLSRADRQDLAQEVVIRVWQQRGQYRSARGNPEQWIRTITKRMSIDFRRSRGRFVPDEVPESMASDAPNPEETVMWSQLAELADHVLAKFPEGERRALILHEIEGKTFEEIAKIEGISKATAHARYMRGMEKLRKAKEDGTLETILVPVALEDGDGPRSEPPTQEMRDRAWQRFVDAGGLDLPREREPPPSGPRRRGPLHRVRKLGPLLAVFLGPALPAPRSEPPPVAVVAVAAPLTTSIAVTSIPVTVPPAATTSTAPRLRPPRRAAPPGQVDREHVTGGAAMRDRLRETASLNE